VQRDLSRIEGHHTAGREAGSIGVNSLEVIEPEADVHFFRIVFVRFNWASAWPIEPAGVAAWRRRGSGGISQ